MAGKGAVRIVILIVPHSGVIAARRNDGIEVLVASEE